MEQDEKELHKIHRMKSDKNKNKAKQEQAQNHYIQKTIHEIKRLPIGKSRLLLLQRSPALDQSLSGELFCTITRTKEGFSLSFMGSGEVMKVLQGEDESLFLAGKEKVLRTLTFENIQAADFQNSDFLDSLIKGWATDGVKAEDVLEYTAEFTKRAPTSLDDYMTCSKRPDKLFWNIVLSLPEVNTKKSLFESTRPSIRSIRLRAELLTLYEAFEQAQIASDYKEIETLSQEVSSKVLLSYRKRYLSKRDFREIKNRLMIIDEALLRANQEASKTIPSKAGLKKYVFHDVSLRKAFIHSPQTAAITTKDTSLFGEMKAVSDEKITVQIEPFSLKTYTSIDSPEAFMESLRDIYRFNEGIRKGTSDESKWAVNEVFRFFNEVSFTYEKIDTQGAKKAAAIIIELTETIANTRSASSITEFDLNALLNMLEHVRSLYNHSSGIALQEILWAPNGFYSGYRRHYHRVGINYPDDLPNEDWDYYNYVHHSHLIKISMGKREQNWDKKHPEFLPVPLKPSSLIFIKTKKNSFSESLIKPPKDCDIVFEEGRHLQKLLHIKSDNHFEFFEYSASLDHWMRPIHNPFLLGLFKKAIIYSWGTETFEAFFDNLEGLFSYYKEELTEADRDDLSFLGTITELKHLSRMLRVENPRLELLGFMKENPHLLHNPEIRNFFDAIFFSIDAKGSFDNQMPRNIIHNLIEEEIRSINAQIDNQLKEDKLEDADLLKARFETLIYYHEILIRLKESSYTKNFPSDKKQLQKLILQCREIPELNSSLGYASRVLLRELLADKHVDIDNMGMILNAYADAYCTFMDPMNIEPYFEQQMEIHFQIIASKLKEIDPNPLKPLLERIFANRGMEFDDRDWNYEGDLVFKNNEYEVDLKYWSVCPLNTSISFGKLPPSIISDSTLQFFLTGENFEILVVQIEEIEKSKVYSFKDHNGISTQIEEKNGKLNLYKKFNDTWLQHLDIRSQKNESTSIPYLDQGLYIDPKDRKKAYVIDSSGTKIDLEIKLKQDGKNLICESVSDLRGASRTGPWQIHNASTFKSKSLDFLKIFENKDQILLWSKREELKRVELIRYGLTFSVKHGKLHCQSEPFIGYIVNANASNAEKNGMHHALLLEHPDPKKPKKLLVANSSSLESRTSPLLPQAKSFGKITLALHYMGVAYETIKKGKLPSVIFAETKRFNSLEKNLPFTTFEIRPYTGEICKTANWPQDLLELMKHAHQTDQPLLTESFLKRFPMKAILQDQELLSEVIQFLHSDGSDPALKLKLGLKLLRFLKRHHKLKKEVKQSLNTTVIALAKESMRAERRSPLQLTDNEKIQLNTLLRKKDLSFYERHINEDLPIWSPIRIEERIANFEEEIDPTKAISEERLGVAIERLETPISLLFTSNELNPLFTSQTKDLPPLNLVRIGEEQAFETVALDAFQKDLDQFRQVESTRTHYLLKTRKKATEKFIKEKLLPKQLEHESSLANLKLEIERKLRQDQDKEMQLAILSGEIKPPTFAELRIAFVQGTLNDLELEKSMSDYFDALSKKNAAAAAISLFERMRGQNTKDWELMSDDLHRLLTIERHYDPIKNPRLLVFEAQMFLNFRNLPGGLNQLDLLEKLINDPRALVQAPTGSGKTAVLSVMESLLKGTGENLVIQKVLPSLYNQTHEKIQEVIGDLFDTLVMPLRFNLKMRLTRNEFRSVINDNGEKEHIKRESSIFKGIYQELLEVILNKGCVLTDYTSLPLMEEKYLQVGQELVECSLNGTQSTDLQKEHYTYLRKILILLRNKGLESMDEFDQPNRPIQKLQLDLQMGANDIPPFLIETSLEIYDLLAKDPNLGLLKNIQSDISKEKRKEAIENAARQMAKTFAPVNVALLTDYFLGKTEDVLDGLDLDPRVLDKMALCKDQFSIYLPLSLNYKQGSRYARSPDGSKTVPCFNGQKHDAKFGTIQEQMNYTIQDYFQAGIQAYDLTTWFKTFKPEWDRGDADQKSALESEFEHLFPGMTVVECADLLKTKTGIQTLITHVNADPSKIRLFLELKLQTLKSSGYIISMDPVNIGDMSRATSGISATSGAPDSLHRQFKADPKAIGQIKAGMAYRMMNRAKDPQTIISYDPEKPEELLQEPYTAVIDGSGAFNDRTQETAESLLNETITQVGYHKEDDSIDFAGISSGRFNSTGFVFNQAHTRGTDILLPPNAHALLTISKDGFRDFAQKEGRLRGEGQTFTLAMPQDQAAANLTEAITSAECVDAFIDAQDIYRHCRQEIPATLRNEALKCLLAFETIEEFVEAFQDETCNALFITKPQKSYREEGSYFADRKHIQNVDTPPQDALEELYQNYAAKAEALNLEIQPIEHSSTLLAKMPPLVNHSQAELECEVHVEQEEEMEAELEMELKLEQQQNVEENRAPQKTTIKYPIRFTNDKKASVSEKIHPAYDALLFVTESFLPYERNKTASKFKRLPFERSMYNIGEIIVHTDNGVMTSAIIQDPMDDDKQTEEASFSFDLRLNVITTYHDYDPKDSAIVDSDVFHHLIAQIKFLDGRTSGYSPEELASLKAWLIASDPEEMKRHFFNEVLLYRYKEKQHFPNSQLGKLFEELL